MAASPPPPHAPSYVYSDCRSVKIATDTIYTRTVSLHCVSANVLSGYCCQKRPSCTACNGTVVPRNGSACASSPMRIVRSGDRTPDTGMAFHRNGSGRGRSGSPPARRICCNRCSGRVFRRSGCAGGFSGCWDGRSFYLREERKKSIKVIRNVL